MDGDEKEVCVEVEVVAVAVVVVAVAIFLEAVEWGQGFVLGESGECVEESIEGWMTVPGIVSACVEVEVGVDGDGELVDGGEGVSMCEEEDGEEGEESVGLDVEGRGEEEEEVKEQEEEKEEMNGVQDADEVAAIAAGCVGERKQDEELKVVWIGREMSICSEEWLRLFSLVVLPCPLIQF